MRIGVHADVEVTKDGDGQGQCVTQVFFCASYVHFLRLLYFLFWRPPFAFLRFEFCFCTPVQRPKRLRAALRLKKCCTALYLTFLQRGVTSQVFASACAVAYNEKTKKGDWEAVSRLVLEGAYEGTLLSAAKGHSDRLYAAEAAGSVQGQVMALNP